LVNINHTQDNHKNQYLYKITGILPCFSWVNMGLSWV